MTAAIHRSCRGSSRPSPPWRTPRSLLWILPIVWYNIKHMDTVESACDALRRGEPVIVLDDAERENEADLILAAEHATAERIRFMVRHTSGLICVALPGERLDELDLPLMVPANSES